MGLIDYGAQQRFYDQMKANSAASGGGSSNQGIIQGAITSAQAAQNKANKANEQRYQQGLGILQTGNTNAGNSIAQAINGVANAGQSGMNRINLQEQNNAGAATQNAVNRGLNNTTIQDSLQRGVQRDANDSRQSLQESVNNQQSNLRLAQANQQSQGAGSIANFIAARNDVSPGISDLAGLISGAAAGGGRSGGGGGYSAGLPPTLPTYSPTPTPSTAPTYYSMAPAANPLQTTGPVSSALSGSASPTSGPVQSALQWQGNTLTNAQQAAPQGGILASVLKWLQSGGGQK